MEFTILQLIDANNSFHILLNVFFRLQDNSLYSALLPSKMSKNKNIVWQFGIFE